MRNELIGRGFDVQAAETLRSVKGIDDVTADRIRSLGGYRVFVKKRKRTFGGGSSQTKPDYFDHKISAEIAAIEDDREFIAAIGAKMLAQIESLRNQERLGPDEVMDEIVTRFARVIRKQRRR